MPGLTRIAELEWRQRNIEARITRCEELQERIDHLRSDRTTCPIGSTRDNQLSDLYDRIDNHLDLLQQRWQDIEDELEGLYNRHD